MINIRLTKKSIIALSITMIMCISLIFLVRIFEPSYTKPVAIYLVNENEWFTEDEILEYKYNIFTNKISFIVPSDSINSDQQLEYSLTNGYILIHQNVDYSQEWYPQYLLSVPNLENVSISDKFVLTQYGVKLFRDGKLIMTYIGTDYTIIQVIE